MSFTHVRPYFRARMKETDDSIVEWKDGFNEDNIPKNVIDKDCYFLEVGKFTSVQLNQPLCTAFTGKCSLRLYINGAKDVQKAIDRSIALGEEIMKRCLMPKYRATQPSIKNVRCDNFDPSPLSRSNDNIVRLTIDFSLEIVLELPKV